MTSPKTKLLICFTTLSLIIGCVPSLGMPTPIPPLDPNAIGTFMVQTADAAYTQTVAALPPSTSTPTATSTPRDTATPEPSFTPVPAYVFPTSVSYASAKYYRVKHDEQLAMYNYKSRTFDDNSEGHLRQAPEVVPLFLQPKTTSGTGRTTVSGAWEVYIDALHNNDQGRARYLKGTRAGLFNTAGFPQLESLTMGGNVITLIQVQGDWGLVNTMPFGGPPNAATVNYVTRPDWVHKFVVVSWRRSTKTTIVLRPPKGDIYWPLVSRQPVWIQMERLEPFPDLPAPVIASKDLYIQTTPGPKVEKTGNLLAVGETATVMAYFPSGSNVWGQLQNGGWIPLMLYPQYTTSWKMETMPPP
jgi:hypothetical protein